MRVFLQNIRKTSQYKAVQNNTTINYDLNAKTYHLNNTSMTVSTKNTTLKTLQTS